MKWLTDDLSSFWRLINVMEEKISKRNTNQHYAIPEQSESVHYSSLTRQGTKQDYIKTRVHNLIGSFAT